MYKIKMQTNFTLIIIKVILVILLARVQGQSDGNNIVFDLADLAVDYQTDNGWISLEAFKSSINDLIIQTNDINKYGQLNWLSIGYPQLVLTPNPINNSINQMFIFKPEGFYVRVEMLTNLQRKLFQGVVQRKYNININSEQIVNLVPSKFECSIYFYVDYKRILINGRVNQFNTFPLKIEFTAPSNTVERLALEKRILNDGVNLDLNIDCEINSKGKAYRQNTLIITGDQLYKIGLMDDLFGPATDRYVTRRQMTDLTSEIYLKLNIIEDYQMPQSQFKENFVNDFIAQAANTTFQSITLENALKMLSQYDFKYDLRPDVIKEDLGKIFSIKKIGTKEQIIANRTNFEYLKTNTRIDTDASVSGSYFDVFDASASYQYATEKSSDWSKSSTSFDSQLKELNDYNENNFEWTRVGEFVKPKTIKVLKLVKSLMSRNLVFSRVKREYYDAPFKRVVSLNTFNNVFLPSNIQENIQRTISLEKNLNYSNYTLWNKLEENRLKLLDILNTNIKVETNDLRNLTQILLKNLDNKITLIQSSVDSTLNKNPCITNPCLNGGTCIKDTNSNALCICSIFYTGSNCGSASNYVCLSNPCQNNGICTSTGKSFYCSCIDDFYGDSCQFAPNPCLSNPCGQSCSISSCSPKQCCSLKCSVKYSPGTIHSYECGACFVGKRRKRDC